MTPNDELKLIKIRISKLNGKISNQVDYGGGIHELERWVDALLEDHKNQTNTLAKRWNPLLISSIALVETIDNNTVHKRQDIIDAVKTAIKITRMISNNNV